MLRILVCCLGGFSSSALSVKVDKEIKERHMEDQVEVNFKPFSLAARDFSGYDIIMVCPHQKYQVKEYNQKYIKNQLPVYLLPPKIYGSMELDTLMEDAIDILRLFKQNPNNPIYFPNEDNVMKIRRSLSYRKTIEKQK